MHFLGLLRNVGQFGHTRLHSIGHFVSRDARGNLRITKIDFVGSVNITQQIERFSPCLTTDALRIGQEQHGIAGAAELDALIDRWQKPAAPAASAAIGSVLPGEHDDESRQVIAFATDAVS